MLRMINHRESKALRKGFKALRIECVSACKINSGAFYLNLLFVEFWVDGPLHRKPSITCTYSRVLEACARH